MRYPLVISVLAALLLAGCQDGQASVPPISQRDYLTVETRRLESTGSGSQILEFSGHLRADRRSRVGFLRPGRVEALYVDEGDRVVPGALLARLDTRAVQARARELQAQLTEAEASLSELEAGPRPYEKAAAQDQVDEIAGSLDLVRTKLERRRSLYSQGAIPKEQVDELESRESTLKSQLRAAQNRVRDLQAGARPQRRDAGRARVNQVRTALDSLRVDLADTELRAPYAGTVAKRFADEGAIVNAGEPVYEILTTDSLEAEIFLPPQHAGRLAVGQTVEVFAEGESYPARVADFLPLVDTESGTRPVLFKLSAVPNLNPGQLIRLRLETKQETDGYWLPATALIPAERGMFVCYSLAPEEEAPDLFRVEKQAVEILTTSGEQAFVRGTLVGRPEVIVEGVQRVVPGQKVRKE